MWPDKWRKVEVKGEVVHFPKGNAFEPIFKSPEEKEFLESNPLELKTVLSRTSVFDHQPIVSPFVRLLPQKPPPDLTGRVLTMEAVAYAIL